MIAAVQEVIFSGTGDIQLEARDGTYQAFLAQVGYSVAFQYLIKSRNGDQLINENSGQWETGIGQLISGDTLDRTTVSDGSLGAGVHVPFNLDRNTVFLLPVVREKYAVVTTDQTLIGTSFTDITGTGLPVLANTTYAFEFHIIADADAATTGIDVACNGPASPTALRYTQTYWTSVTADAVANQSTYDANTANVGSAGTRRAIYTVIGVLINGANAGTLIGRIKREAVGTGPNVRSGTYHKLVQLS